MSKEQEEYIAFCLDCGSDQPDQYIESSPFYRDGSSTPCKWCYGVTTIGLKKNKSEIIRRNKQRRGI